MARGSRGTGRRKQSHRRHRRRGMQDHRNQASDTERAHANPIRTHPERHSESGSGNVEAGLGNRSGHLPPASLPSHEGLQDYMGRNRSYGYIGGVRGAEGMSRATTRRRGSADSYWSRTDNSESANLADAILHYMPEIDVENRTDLLASRYYGNMSSLPEVANRHPRPMNSTLPLFSPSVVNGRIVPRARSSHTSDASPQRMRSRTSYNERVSTTDRQPTSSKQASSSNMALEPVPSRPGEDNLAEERVQPEPSSTADKLGEGTSPSHLEQPLEPANADMRDAKTTSPRSRTTSPSSHEISEAVLAEEHPQAAQLVAEQSPTRRASTGSCVETAVNEKTGALGLGVSSRSHSRARGARAQHMGATQYTPAAASRKNAIARAAPGISYMFSPAVGPSGSRPPSVMGSATPVYQQGLPHIQSQVVLPPRGSICPSETQHPGPQLPNSSDAQPETRRGSSETQQQQPPPPIADMATTNDSTPKDGRKMYGAINIGTLEQFLAEGKVPDSSSDECLSDVDFDWEEDYCSEASMTSDASLSGRDVYQHSPQRRLYQSYASPALSGQRQPSLRQYASLDERDIGLPSALPRTPLPRSSQPSPRIRSYGRLSDADERSPLLPLHHRLQQHQQQQQQRKPTHRPNDSEASEYFVPADAPFVENFRPSPAGHRWGRRRRRRNHEELFLDKDGFIDESYRFTFFNPAVGTIRAQEIADLRTPTMDLAALLQVGGCFWIDILRPSFQEMHLMSKIFGLHALTVEDVMTQDAREKCEIHSNYYFVCFRSFDNDPNSETYLEPKCIYNVVLREGMLTFHMDPSVHQYHVLRRIRRQIDHIVVTPDWLNYAVIDDVTDLLAPILQGVEFDVDSIDELVLVISSSEQSDMLLRISTARKRIMMAMRLLQGKADVVRALIKRFESATALNATQMNAITAGSLPGYLADRQQFTGPATAWSESPRFRATNGDAGWAPVQQTELPDNAIDMAMDQRKGHETTLYLGDVLDHIVTMMQNAAHYDNMLGRAQTNYLAQISVELTVSSNNTNDVVAKLSALAAVLLPLNFVTGMWGANVKVPGQDYDDLYYFFYILAACMLYVVVAVIWARRFKIF
ncbi:CorA metal ion transporter [Coemansia guatemalensis]|uniref:CorA metal ion transporter n=1 Tax=Coemansia guatemalensis TaxID=2761395 RepID=A0A9W8HTK9_9FUNG|nr:CorA metal ion transporter [Coemansia guatemalensis]